MTERQLNRNPVELRLGDPDDPIILTGNSTPRRSR